MQAEGRGEAFDATVVVVDNVEVAAVSPSPVSEYERSILEQNVERAKGKVAKLEAHLSAARVALADAEAELEGALR